MKYNYIVVALLAQMTAVQVAADTGYDYLGYGRLVTNDLLGDGKDRWRTGSVSAFRMYVQEDVDLKHLKLGQAVELRTHFEVVAPSDLQDDSGGDRPWGGAISLGLHSPFHYGSLQMSLGADVHVIGQNSGLTGFQQDLHNGLGVKHAGDAVSNNQIKDETVMGGAAAAAYPIGLSDRVQARPYGEVRAGLEDVASVGMDVYFGALDATPAMSRDPVTGHRYPVEVEQNQDRGILFSLGYDFTDVQKSRFLPRSAGVSHVETRSRTRMGMTFKRGSWSVFGGLTLRGKEFEGQEDEQMLGSIRLFSRF